MNVHDTQRDLFTDRSRPRTRGRVGADRIGSRNGSEQEQGPLATEPGSPSVTSRSGTNAAREPEPETVPFAKFDLLRGKLEENAEELAALRQALAREHRATQRLQAKLDEIAAIDAGDEEAQKKLSEREQTILTFLAWWRDYTGRPQSTRVDLTTHRATLVRRELSRRPAESRRTPQELCWMVIGMCRDEWYVQHEKTDIKHMLKDEAIAERFLKMGRPKESA